MKDDLVTRARNGDEAAWAELYAKYHNRTFAVCKRIVRDDFLAEDLTQEAFLSAWKHIRKFRMKAHFSTWLYRIAYNASLIHLRKQARRIHMIQEDVPYLSFPAACTRDSDLNMDLTQAIAALPPGRRRVFSLYAIEGFNQDEIARMLNVHEGSVKSQYWRARHQLLAALV